MSVTTNTKKNIEYTLSTFAVEGLKPSGLCASNRTRRYRYSSGHWESSRWSLIHGAIPSGRSWWRRALYTGMEA